MNNSSWFSSRWPQPLEFSSIYPLRYFFAFVLLPKGSEWAFSFSFFFLFTVFVYLFSCFSFPSFFSCHVFSSPCARILGGNVFFNSYTRLARLLRQKKNKICKSSSLRNPSEHSQAFAYTHLLYYHQYYFDEKAQKVKNKKWFENIYARVESQRRNQYEKMWYHLFFLKPPAEHTVKNIRNFYQFSVNVDRIE